jgi:hypothetical protein
MIHNAATDGERLCNFINNRLLASAQWDALAEALESTGRSPDLLGFYRQMTSVALTCRIVSAGLSFDNAIGIHEPAFRREYAQLLLEYVRIPSRLLNETYRFSERATTAALEPLPNSVRRRVEAVAKRHPYCYICVVALDFSGQPIYNSFTCEHVWPRACGGNSIIENLLPACQSCNSEKANFATWVMPAIQSLTLGVGPGDDKLQKIHGSFKFAMYYRVAQRFAINNHLTLKEAFLRLGPWQDVRIRDVDDIADIFNLENHDPDRILA